MFCSLFQDRRGVSEIIASLLIVLVVSIAGAALYSYSSEAFASSSNSFQLLTDKREERARERFSIIAVWQDTDDQINVTILNHGKIDLTIDAVYIDGSAATIRIGRGETITRGDLISLKFISPFSIEEGHTYEIIAVSERGSKDAVYWKS